MPTLGSYCFKEGLGYLIPALSGCKEREYLPSPLDPSIGGILERLFLTTPFGVLHAVAPEPQ
jgi:hypothetical protein